MIHLQGVPIEVLVKTPAGVDALNAPVYDERWETVENVLVGLSETGGTPTATDLPGRTETLTLAIPKGDAHAWTDTLVRLPKPWDGVYRTVGFPLYGIEENIPLCWNAKVRVERNG